MKDQSTAILIFAQQSDQEVGRKKWIGPDRVSIRLIKEWNRKTLSIARKTGSPVLLSTDLIDHEGSFHDQINNAFNRAFDLGFENILCIGNDCPGLHSESLKTALTLLESGKTVLGPDHSGGVYLIGINRQIWKNLEVSQIPWQEHNLFDHLHQVVSQSSEVGLLEKLHDIHSAKAIRQSWLDRELSLSEMLDWQQFIRKNEQTVPSLFTENIPVRCLCYSRDLRGPPLARLTY